jgi:23S rRNA (guanine2445-N2)-methyltransferase / 23S rRNA (guanine2069-N7)-methyltransferase
VSELYTFLASAPRGLADLLAQELRELGASEVRDRSTDVAFKGSLAVGYRACLESRVANRVYLKLAEYTAATTDEFYQGARAVDWAAHLARGTTLACDFSGRHPTLTHSHFATLKLKDAIVDTLRDAYGERPDIVTDQPGVRVHAHARGTAVTLALDLSGESLHRRGYRTGAGAAPLKENVAAGILLRTGWPVALAEQAEFLDPMCGAGTLVIEAAWIAAQQAPGSLRDYFGFLGWRQHDAELWQRIKKAADDRVRKPAVFIRGQDQDLSIIKIARANAKRAGVADFVQFGVADIKSTAPAGTRPGVLVVNPPYGVRLEEQQTARMIHRDLGQVLRERFTGWSATVLTAGEGMGLELGLRAHRVHTLWNGAIECRLLRFKIATPGAVKAKPAVKEPPSAGAVMFANRIKKNLQHRQKWARQQDIGCYRLYDADMPEYAFAIDIYTVADSNLTWLYLQEYAAPDSIDPAAVRRRRREAFGVLPEVVGIPAERIRVRLRRAQKGRSQYQRQANLGQFHQIMENGLKFVVNFEDYLDTGLFLDHRLIRTRLRALSASKRVLNLFAYTATAAVYAAAGGARATLSLDLSYTYLNWAERNFVLNALDPKHHGLLQADCLEWLRATERATEERYDVIFLDPPTFSNSKRMQDVLDIRRDHVKLIDDCMRLLAPQGVLLFSTNAQKFKLDAQLEQRYEVRDTSQKYLPEDFKNNPRIHRSFELRVRSIANRADDSTT